MSLAITIKAMAAAGCTVEQIASVAEQFEERELAAVAEKRARDAERKRRSRASAMSHGQTVTSRTDCDIADISGAYKDSACAPALIPVGISNDIPPIDSPLPSEGPPKGAKNPSPQKILSTVLSEKTAGDVVAHRKALRKPLTPRAAELLAKSFSASGDAERAAATMIERGWQGYRPDWDTPLARAGPAAPQRDYGKGALVKMLKNIDEELANGPGRHAEIEIPGGNVLRLPIGQGE